MTTYVGLLGTASMLLACSGADAPAADASEDAPEDFRTRVVAALEVEDSNAAMLALIFTEGMDEWESDLAGRTAERLVGARRSEISFEPLPDDFRAVNVVDGAEYRPQPAPEGLLVLSRESGGTSSIPYGREQGRYWIVGTRRTIVDAEAKDATLQIAAIGFASPPAEFEGWCDILLSNGQTRRVEIDDQDIGNQTQMLHGQRIEACEVRNTGGRGSLELRLQVDTEVVFEGRAELPDSIVRYDGR